MWWRAWDEGAKGMVLMTDSSGGYRFVMIWTWKEGMEEEEEEEGCILKDEEK